MSKIDRWKEIFSTKGKTKTPVKVGDKVENLTRTQAYRFKKLKASRSLEPQSGESNGGLG